MRAGVGGRGKSDIDVALVDRLVAAQFPQWAGLPVEPVDSAGTSNAMYRLGEDMVVRLPRIAGPPAMWSRSISGCRGSPHRFRLPFPYRWARECH